jgi:hypothetical protein
MLGHAQNRESQVALRPAAVEHYPGGSIFIQTDYLCSVSGEQRSNRACMVKQCT